MNRNSEYKENYAFPIELDLWNCHSFPSNVDISMIRSRDPEPVAQQELGSNPMRFNSLV